MAKDPVCGMQLDEAKAGATAVIGSGLAGMIAGWVMPTAASAQERIYDSGWGMHPMWWMWGAWGIGMMFVMLVFWGVVIAGIVLGPSGW